MADKAKSKLESAVSELDAENAAARQNLKDTASTLGGKALNALGAPQRAMSRGFAQMSGLKPAQTSEENFQNIADLVPDINPQQSPIASTLLSGAKALGVAGAEVLADPLAALPLAKGAAALKKLPTLRELAQSAVKSGALENAGKIFGGGTVAKVKPNYGKVIMAPEKTAIKQSAESRAKYLADLAKAVGPNAQIVSNESSRATKTVAKQNEALERAYKGPKNGK